MSTPGDSSNAENMRSMGFSFFRPAYGQSGILYTMPPTDLTEPTTTTTPTSPSDITTLSSIINTLQTELNAATSVNTHLAASVARLQAELSAHFATTVARLQAEHASSTPAMTTTTTTSTAPPFPSSHSDHPRTIATGRGAASPEVFQEVIKTNWHGRLGRTHMVDVDSLPASSLTELDCLLRRQLHRSFPRGQGFKLPDRDSVFGALAGLGLRLEDRGTYTDVPLVDDNTLIDQSMVRRAKNFANRYYAGNYLYGSVLETLLELARYRGLIDDEGFLKME